MPNISCQNGQPMHRRRRSNRNILEAWIVSARVIKHLACGVRALKVEGEELLRIKIFDALPPIVQSLRFGCRAFPLCFSDPGFDFGGGDHRHEKLRTGFVEPFDKRLRLLPLRRC